MLIIPAEQSVDWRRPPLVTLALMLTCLLVFLFYQGRDSRLMQAAANAYLERGLVAVEAPLYEGYLQRQIRLENRQHRIPQLEAVRRAMAADEQLPLALAMLSDRAFFSYLQANRDMLWSPAQRQRWQQLRVPIQTDLIERISANELGLIPDEPGLFTLVTYQFLHGGWGHLVGNLVFLFLLGFTVEKALGPGRYLLAYLLCGVLSGVIYTFFSLGSKVPLVGASGSISGLMGMYVAIFGMRRIRFFFWLGVYFNYFRAPALAILPVWVGKELFDYYNAGATGIAYMAHAGGLVAGAALILVLGKGWFQVQEAFFEPEPDAEDETFTRAYAQAMASLGRLDFDLAREQFETLWQRYPRRPVLLEHLYQLARLRPDSARYRERARELMLHYLGHQQPEKLVRVWTEYLKTGQAHHPLEAADHSRVMVAALRQDDLGIAEKAFEQLRGSGNPDLVEEARHLLLEAFRKRGMTAKAHQYQGVMR